jgi:hypothetical protein
MAYKSVAGEKTKQKRDEKDKEVDVGRIVVKNFRRKDVKGRPSMMKRSGLGEPFLITCCEHCPCLDP